MPSFELIISPVKKQRHVGKTTNRKRNLPDISIAAVNDVSANEALGSVDCIDGKTVAKATCDTNEVQPVDLMHVSPVKKQQPVTRSYTISKQAKKKSLPHMTVIIVSLKEFQYFESCAVDLGSDAISVDAGKVSGNILLKKQLLKALLKVSNHLLKLSKHMMQHVLMRLISVVFMILFKVYPDWIILL